jgi:3-dehydroquinate dehydratase / shikimate dehydrogenase
MICISIAQESRRLAMADMLNAAMMGADLLEVRLDCFENDPDPKELLIARRKPVIFSCRRQSEGGGWKGTEDARITLLKTAIISQPDYCELELDIADKVRRFGPCQRVVSYTNLKETPSDVGEIYEEARRKDPDIIKLTCRARTPEEAWPLVQILAKPPVPTVVVGLGRPGVMLAILGRRMGSPFTFAALERGMEVYPGQPTVVELDNIYHYRAIDKHTKMVGVTGVDQRAYLTTAMLNAAFAHLNLPIRCLPLQVGDVKLFRRIVEAVKLLGVVVEEDQQEALREVAAEIDADPAAVELNPGGLPVERAVDLLVQPEPKKWQGAHTFTPGVIAALEYTLKGNGKRLEGLMVMIAGLTPQSRSLARAVKERGGKLIFAGDNRDEAAKCSRMFGGRNVPFEGIYSTLHDVIVVSREPGDDGSDERRTLLPNYLRAGMTVMDLTDLPRETGFTREARLRGCHVVSPQTLQVEQVRTQVKRLTGQEVAAAPLEAAIAGLVDED